MPFLTGLGQSGRCRVGWLGGKVGVVDCITLDAGGICTYLKCFGGVPKRCYRSLPYSLLLDHVNIPLIFLNGVLVAKRLDYMSRCVSFYSFMEGARFSEKLSLANFKEERTQSD